MRQIGHGEYSDDHDDEGASSNFRAADDKRKDVDSGAAHEYDNDAAVRGRHHDRVSGSVSDV